MASTFSWLDHSEAERRKVLNVIELFRETDTRDELGIGVARDAFADLLFPGTSTTQTRARYLLFIPWVFLELEARKVPSRHARGSAREREVQLIKALEAGGETTGVIGIVAKSQLKRLPSSIYWHGLGVLGIRRFHGSIEEYFRSLDSFYRLDRATLRSEEGEVLERAPRRWHPSLPEPPHDLFQKTNLTLTRNEAEYLRERIMSEIPDSMLAQLVNSNATEVIDYPWQHPDLARFPDHLQEWLGHARNFSEAIHGAPLLYNLMLAEHAERDDLQNTYTYALEEWAAMLLQRRSAFAAWDLGRFWQIVQKVNPRVKRPTKTFIEHWIREFALKRPSRVATDKQARRLIGQRERALKGSQARLVNRRALELWNTAAGTARLTYRWPIAQAFVDDIVTGLRQARDA